MSRWARRCAMCSSNRGRSLERYLKLQPVIDGVEGDFTKTDGLARGAGQAGGQCSAERQGSGRDAAAQGLEGGEGGPADAASGQCSGAR